VAEPVKMEPRRRVVTVPCLAVWTTCRRHYRLAEPVVLLKHPPLVKMLLLTRLYPASCASAAYLRQPRC